MFNECYRKMAVLSYGHAEAVLTNFSKAFDSIDYDLFITKFKDYGFYMTSLYFVYSDFTGRKQRKSKFYI